MFQHPASLFCLPFAMTSTTQTICIKQHFGFPGHRSICPDIACLPSAPTGSGTENSRAVPRFTVKTSRKPARAVLADLGVGFRCAWLCNPGEHQTSAWIATR